jgi:hypothetical protein
MLSTARVLFALAWLAGVLPVAEGLAQAPTRPAASATAETTPDVPPGLPRPPEEPASLFVPPRPQVAPPPLPGPYFEPDPRLDRPPLPPPGWFGDVEVNVLGPYVKNKLVDTVQIGTSAPDTVQLPSARLNWTVSPTFEVGYRLPSAFGAFAVAYRFLASDGSGTTAGPDGPATLASRLDLQVFDLDYISREIALWPCWDMRWFFGGRLVNVYFDSRSQEPVAEAAAGSGVVERRDTDRYVGFGPHWGLEVERHLADWGLTVVGRVDGSLALGRIRQGFFEESTTLGADGVPLGGQMHVRSSQAVPMVRAQLGLSWQPSEWPQAQFFAGYQYEHWFNIGRLSLLGDDGELEAHGLWLEAAYRF